MSEKLTVLLKPCSSGTCPALYRDEQNRIFIQGNKLGTTARQDIEVGTYEEVVEISEELLVYLRTL
ncbi:hypothetical protein PN498_13350 [Oscillatoria sp. CS-180]|uniref:hypothetical protein n=1 Tax=Oscillatoria sp. CS-180 TaxID=3021720 RepID=UPI00232B7CFA|nr:hypothetical protein [Oscillatoria sp. CS-180]MDB9526980.1 hypothetical protein [Oscillatoria sp. CS-180]